MLDREVSSYFCSNRLGDPSVSCVVKGGFVVRSVGKSSEVNQIKGTRRLEEYEFEACDHIMHDEFHQAHDLDTEARHVESYATVVTMTSSIGTGKKSLPRRKALL
jgi:hypothetical protein